MYLGIDLIYMYTREKLKTVDDVDTVVCMFVYLGRRRSECFRIFYILTKLMVCKMQE